MTKTILITGGTGKLGAQFVKHFMNKNFNVIFTSLKQSEIDALLKNEILNNKKTLGIEIDLEKKDLASNILNFLTKKKLFPNILVNCARSLAYLKINNDGITQRDHWLGEFTLDTIVPYELSMALAKHPKSKLENIINISSMYGIVPANPNLYKNPEQESPIQYGVCKAAQIHLTKELAIRLAPKNIKVNSISFGGVEGRVDSAFKKRYSKLCPLGKMLQEKEVIGAIDFLTSENANYITGHNLVVDGGWTIW